MSNLIKRMGTLFWIIFAQILLEKFSCSGFASVVSVQRQNSFMMATTSSSDTDENTRMFTEKLVTLSGKPVCRYGLGGAARSTQPESLPLKYRDILKDTNSGAPFYFYYNPHRYPLFLSGVSEAFDDDESRRDMFMVSGGTERSPAALDKRLDDALAFCGGEYLDGFVLEYVCPEELDSDTTLGKELRRAIEHVHSYVRDKRVRYVMASTHSHRVGRVLVSEASLDAIMLRYNMSHKKAAETISFPEALAEGVPVLAFTTTRWNALQRKDSPTVSTADCITFAFEHPAVEVVLHSARDESELDDALLPLIARSSASEWMGDSEYEALREFYNGSELDWNDDCYDEYPDESI